MDGLPTGPTPRAEPGIDSRPRPLESDASRLDEVGSRASEWLPAALEELLLWLLKPVHEVASDHAHLAADPRGTHRLNRRLCDAGVDALPPWLQALLDSDVVSDSGPMALADGGQPDTGGDRDV